MGSNTVQLEVQEQSNLLNIVEKYVQGEKEKNDNDDNDNDDNGDKNVPTMTNDGEDIDL
jgi:hypothetical protein